MWTADEVTRKITELCPWGQNIHLVDDIFTGGPLDTQTRWDVIKDFLPRDVTSLRVLDIGCNAGFFSIKMKTLGARCVVGIDFEHCIRQAEFVAEVKKCQGIEFRAQSFYHLAAGDQFDLTLCLGVLYHFKHPYLAIQKLADVTSEMIVLETEALADPRDVDKMKFIEHTYRNDGTIWWIAGEECLKGMLRSVGFRYLKTYSYPEDHVPFGKYYSQGLTGEGIEKGKRIVIIGLKTLHLNRMTPLLPEIPEFDNGIDLESFEGAE